MVKNLKYKLYLSLLFTVGIGFIFLFMSIPYIVKIIILKNSYDTYAFSDSFINYLILIPDFIFIVMWGYYLDKANNKIKKNKKLIMKSKPKANLFNILCAKYKVYLSILVIILFIIPTSISILPRYELKSYGIVKFDMFNNIIDTIKFDQIKIVEMGLQKESNRSAVHYNFYYTIATDSLEVTFNTFKNDKAIFEIYDVIKNASVTTVTTGIEFVPVYKEQQPYMHYDSREKEVFNSWFKSKP